jgi:hypothetical protein
MKKEIELGIKSNEKGGRGIEERAALLPVS